MNIYARRGSKIVFKNVNAGRDYDQEKAREHLVVGQVYTVEFTEVGGWHTNVYLQEIPNVAFNSVLFEDYNVEHTIRLQGCDAHTMFIMELTEEEIACLKKISEKTKEVSTYSCMPILIVSETTEDDRLELEEDDYEF